MGIQDDYFDIHSDLINTFGEHSTEVEAFERFSSWAFENETKLETVQSKYNQLKTAIQIIKDT